MKKRRSAARRPGGYTLIELMVAASVASALAALAVPSFDRLVQDNRRTAVVNELLATVMLARSEAAKRRQGVIVCGIHDANRNGRLDESERHCAGQDWSDGWITSSWRDTDGDGRVDAAELSSQPLKQVLTEHGSIRVAASAFAAAPAPAGVVILRTFGQASANGTLTVCDARGAAHARAVIVSPNGRSRIARHRADGGALGCGP